MATYPFTYSAQIKRYISQFLRIFRGFQVQYGVDRDGDGILDQKPIPVFYGSMDRVVASIIKDRNAYQSPSVPAISGYLTGISLNPEKARSKRFREPVVLERTDGTRTVTERIMPVPYRANMDVTLWASNSNQMFQILEQILLLFRPYLTIQKSDDIRDWTSITHVEMTSIVSGENFPAGPSDRLIQYTLTFEFDFYLNYPVLESDNVIEQIITNINDDTYQPTVVDTFVVDETTEV